MPITPEQARQELLRRAAAAELQRRQAPRPSLIDRTLESVWNYGPGAIVRAIRTRTPVGETARLSEILTQLRQIDGPLYGLDPDDPDYLRKVGPAAKRRQAQIGMAAWKQETAANYAEAERRADAAIEGRLRGTAIPTGSARETVARVALGPEHTRALGHIIAGNQIPMAPAETIPEKIAQTVGGVGGFAANLALTRRAVPGLPPALQMEATTELQGEPLGSGLAMAGMMGAAGKIAGVGGKAYEALPVGKRVLRRTAKAGIEAAGFGGLAAAQGAPPEEILIQAAIPFMFAAGDARRELTTEGRRRALKEHIRKIAEVDKAVPLKTVKAAEAQVDAGGYDAYIMPEAATSAGVETPETFKPRVRVRAGLGAEEAAGGQQTLYHGGTATNTLSIDRARRTEYGPAVYLTSKQEAAQRYADNVKGQVTQWTVSQDAKLAERAADESLPEFAQRFGVDTSQSGWKGKLHDALIEQGYNGVIHRGGDATSGADVVALFSPTLVSAADGGGAKPPESAAQPELPIASAAQPPAETVADLTQQILALQYKRVRTRRSERKADYDARIADLQTRRAELAKQVPAAEAAATPTAEPAESQKTIEVSDTAQPPAADIIPPTISSAGAEVRPPISTRNVDTGMVRAELGLPPIPRTPHVSLVERQAAWAAQAPEPDIIDRIAEEIVQHPRALLPNEAQGLGSRIEDIWRRYDILAEQAEKLPAGSEELKQNLDARRTLRDHNDLLLKAAHLGGTPWSEMGLARQNLKRRLNDETSPLAMEAKAVERKGDKLTDSERADIHEASRQVRDDAAKADVARRKSNGKRAVRILRAGRSRYAKMTEAEKDAEINTLLQEIGEGLPDADTLYRLAMNLASRPGIRTIGDITARLQERFDRLTSDVLSDAITEATTRKAREVDMLREQLAAVKREGRKSTRFRMVIDNFLWHLAHGTIPEAEGKLRNETQYVTAIRDTLAYYRKQLQNSEPVQVAHYEKLIKILEHRIETGDFTVAEKAPISEVVADLQARYKRLQAEFRRRQKVDPTAKILRLEREVADIEDRVRRRAYRKMPRTGEPREAEEIDVLLARKQAAQTELSRIRRDRQELSSLRGKIKALRQHINEGTLPPKPVKFDIHEPNPAAVSARELVAELEKQLARTPAAQKVRLERVLANLRERLRTGNYGPPPMPKRDRIGDPEVEKLAYQVYRARHELARRIAALDPWWRHPDRSLTQPFREIQAWKSSFDMSALARQGGIALRSHPIRTLRRLPEAIRACFDPERAWKINHELLNGERSWYYHRHGLELTDYDGRLSEREEALASTWLEGHKYLGLGVRGSNRGFVTLLNLIRVDSFEAMTRGAYRPEGLTFEESKAIAAYVNVMTGRGSLAGLEKAAPVLNGILWSPRFTLSRIQFRLGVPIGQAPTWRTRRIIAQEYARYLVGAGVSIWLYEHVFGGKVERDKLSADYGKIVIGGNTRLDPLSGLSQITVLLERQLQGKSKTQKGSVVSLNPDSPSFPYRGDTRPSLAWRFIRYKLGFLPGKTVDWWYGSNAFGRPWSWKREIASAPIPLGFEEIIKIMEEQGIAKGTALETLNLLGEGVQVYDQRPRGPRRQLATRRGLRRRQP